MTRNPIRDAGVDAETEVRVMLRVLGHVQPLNLLWAVRWTLDNHFSVDGLDPLEPAERVVLGWAVEAALNHIEQEGI